MNEQNLAKTNINWATHVLDKTLSNLDKIWIFPKQVFTDLYKIRYEL